MESNSTWMFFELVETEHAVKQSAFKKDGEKLSVPLRSIWNTSSFIISKPHSPREVCGYPHHLFRDILRAITLLIVTP
jgi:hypothetical protein